MAALQYNIMTETPLTDTNRDGGNTAKKTTYIAFTAETAFTAYTAFTVYSAYTG